MDDNLEMLKKKLKEYGKENIYFNEPHFSHQLISREGDKKEVVENLLNPEKLVYAYEEKGKLGDTKHCLHFRISNTRTMKLPVIFDPKGRKGLYILTYIMSYSPWQSLVKRKR